MTLDQDQVKIDRHLFECPLCMLILYEPITTNCGHTYCKTCLHQSLKISKKKCPQCRSPCLINPREIAETKIISDILLKNFPSEMNERKLQVDQINALWSNELPIFLHNQIIFPTSIISLNIFELRYRHMIQKVIQTNRQFIYLPQIQNFQNDIGLLMNINSYEILPDDRVIIQCVALQRVKILQSWIEDGTQGLMIGLYESFYDDNYDLDQVNQIVQECKSILNQIRQSQNLDVLFNKIGQEPDLNNLELWAFWAFSFVNTFLQNEQWALNIIRINSSFTRLKNVLNMLKQLNNRLNQIQNCKINNLKQNNQNQSSQQILLNQNQSL